MKTAYMDTQVIMGWYPHKEIHKPGDPWAAKPITKLIVH
jgi:hypothetical protein